MNTTYLNSAVSNRIDQGVSLSIADEGKTVTISAGQRLSVRLPFSIFASHMWVETSEPTHVRLTHITFENLSANASDENRTQTSHFRVSNLGPFTLRLEYRRIGELFVSGAKIFTAQVNVIR